jgi:hypothetical protein
MYDCNYDGDASDEDDKNIIYESLAAQFEPCIKDDSGNHDKRHDRHRSIQVL